MFLIELHDGHRIMYSGGEIVLDTSEPLKLYYLEPWQISSKYLKKIKMKFPFGVLFNLHKNIWLSLPVHTIQGLLGVFHGAVTVAQRSALSFSITNSSTASFPGSQLGPKSLEINESSC